jgi:hypothetical protein
MAHPVDTRGLALDEYTKSCPPGWRPHMASYPLRTYVEKFELWMNMTDIQHHQIGSTMVGRLKEAAYRLAMKARITLQDGTVLLGSNAVIFPGEPAIEADAHAGVVAVPRTSSGVETIFAILQAAYGDVEMDMQGLALDRFFELYRGSSSLSDYCTAFLVRLETAGAKAGLEVNDVCKTHLFMTHAGLTNKFIDDIYLKIDGDRTRFHEVYAIVQRTAKQHQQNPDEAHGHILLTQQQQIDVYYGNYHDEDEEEDEDEYPQVEYFTDNLWSVVHL